MLFRKLLLLLVIIVIQSCFTKEKVNSEKVKLEDKILKIDIDPSITNLIDETVLAFPQQTELSVAFTSGDSISFYGAKNLEGKLELLDNKLSLFEIGSITKVFTSDLLVQSVQEQKIGLSQPLMDFFDFDLKNKKKITLEQLASHSSGLPSMPEYFFNPLVDEINPYKLYTEELMLADLESKIELSKETSEQWIYSNYAVSLLGYIVAKQNNLTYAELLSKNIFQPLGMKFSGVNRSALHSKQVQGLNAMGEPTSHWDLNAIVPAGGIVSNTHDLSKYTIACYDDENKVFPQQSMKILNQPRKSVDQALGWMIYNRKDGSPYCYMHSGQTGGFASLMLLQPGKKKSIIILSNISEEGNAILSLGFKLLKGLNEGSYESKK